MLITVIGYCCLGMASLSMICLALRSYRYEADARDNIHIALYLLIAVECLK